MTVKEKIINRLNKGFNGRYNIPYDARWKTNQARGMWVRSQGAQSWYFSDLKLHPHELVGSQYPATECLKWRRWLIDLSEREIFEYIEGVTTFNSEQYLLETILNLKGNEK